VKCVKAWISPDQQLSQNLSYRSRLLIFYRALYFSIWPKKLLLNRFIRTLLISHLTLHHHLLLVHDTHILILLTKPVKFMCVIKSISAITWTYKSYFSAVFIFPAVSPRLRFLIHQVVESNFESLKTFSIGTIDRRTVICPKSIYMEKEK